jgi:pyridoxamine 5'-phosphate oxidase
MKSLGKNCHFCLSTISENGFPNSRFVDLKSIDEESLHFGTDSRSKKSVEFSSINKIAACAWWEPVGIQIRLRGTISRATLEISETAFQSRNLLAKATTRLSHQSQSLTDPEELRTRILEYARNSSGTIDRPETWWIWAIRPFELEILEFTEDRIHKRTLYEKNGEEWIYRRLNP